MLIERIYDEDLAQASYLIGCQANGTAVVVDGRRDIAVYQDLAEKNGMKIVAVTETHIHADYLSGTRELAAATGAKIYVSGEGGPDWQYEFDGERLYDGDKITIGNISIQAVHTPGHTPEHLSFLVTDGAFSDQPGYLLSGDFVFSGDLGRPDLLDEAAGGIDTRFEGAKQLFASLRDKFLTLPDYVQVHPAHGAGSACGKALGAIPSSTVGYERLYAWWGPYLAANDEQGFIDELLDGQPDAHAYFGRMKRENREGPAVMGERTPLHELDTADVAKDLAAGQPHLHRHPPQHRSPRRHRHPFPERSGRQVRGQLRRLGGQPGNRQEPAGAPGPRPGSRPGHVGPPGPGRHRQRRRLRHQHRRAPHVHAEADPARGTATASMRPWCWMSATAPSTPPGTSPAPTSSAAAASCGTWTKLPTEGTIVTYCQSGVRNSVAASALRRAGYDVVELDGSYAAWTAWQQTREAASSN